MLRVLAPKDSEISLRRALAIFNGNIKPDKLPQDERCPDQPPRTRCVPELVLKHTCPRFLVGIAIQGFSLGGLLQHVG